MRFLSLFTAVALSTQAIASPLNSVGDNESVKLETRASCNKSHLDIFNNAITYGMPFCEFYHAYPRTRTPIPGLSVTETSQVCECMLTGTFKPAFKVGERRAAVSIVTVARTTARSIPVLTVGTVTEKVTKSLVEFVTLKAPAATETVFRTITKNAAQAKPATITIAKTTTITNKVQAKPSTVTVARTTVTSKVASGSGAGSGSGSNGNAGVAGGSRVTVTIAKTTIAKTTVAKTTITSTKKSTITVAKITVTARNNAAAVSTMIKTVTLKAVGSAQNTVTKTSIRTVTANGNNAVPSTVTETSVQTITRGASKSTVTTTSVQTVTAKASSVAQSTVTKTSVQTVTGKSSVTTVTVTTKASNAAQSTVISTVTTTKISTVAGGAALSSSTGISTSTSTTSTKPVCVQAPTETPPLNVQVADTQYERFYRGCGFTEAFQNPGTAYYSENFPTDVTVYNNTITPSDAVQMCAMEAYYLQADPNEYLSFDLHFITTTGTGLAGEGGQGYWECVKFFSEQSDVDASPYFNITNQYVAVAYGYSSGLYSDSAAAAAGQNAKRGLNSTTKVGGHPASRGQKLVSIV